MSKDVTLGERKNPFPGLRPFREDEDYLFFGRESQVDAMVNKLAATKFLAVVGTSGSGKSSLVNCGLRPALHAGLMTSASTDWRIAKLRPGNDPINALASALSGEGVLFQDFQHRGLNLEEIIDATLRMSKLGLIDTYEQSQLDKDINLLVIVDQFEELFRYSKLGSGGTDSTNHTEAVAFVNLLLEAAQKPNYPVYVVITMRSDFLGDCSQFQGLPEAINSGQYLVPRLSREERRAAIKGPIKVAGADISPILLTRLVNDVGDNPDQLSILQHALNRTWAYWQHQAGANGPIELSHYQAIGTMSQALNHHAEKAYHELHSSRQRYLCEKVFRVLTDTASDPRGVRRPTTLGTLCSIANASEEEVVEIIDVFRKPSRSFLMPPVGVDLDSNSVIDISHESLMRVWTRLKGWAYEEAQSAQMYGRLANTSRLHKSDRANLWRDPDLQLALDWKKKEKPTVDWAKQYDNDFGQAMDFLQKSKETRDYDLAESKFTRRLRQFRTAFLIIALAMLSYSLLWNPSTNRNIGEFMMGDKVRTALRSQLMVAVPPNVFRDLENIIESSNRTGPTASSKENLPDILGENPNIIKALELDSAGHVVYHIYKAMERYDFRLPHVMLLKRSTPDSTLLENEDIELQDLWVQENKILKDRYNKEFDPVFALILDSISAKNKSFADVLRKHEQILERQGIVMLTSGFNIKSPKTRQLRLVPHSFMVMGPKPGNRISFAMQTGFGDVLLKNPTRVNRVEGLLTIFFYFLFYLAFVSVFGIVYRKLAFHPLGQSPLDQFWQTISKPAKRFIDLFKSRLWNITFSVFLLLIALSLIYMGLAAFWNFSILLLGLIVLLSVSLKPLMRPYWALRFKGVQGLLLKLIGFYILSLCISNIISPVFSLGSSLILAFVGIAIIMLGTKKRSLSAKDKLLRTPDRPPVLYFRSPPRIDRSSKSLLGRWMGYAFLTVDEKVLSHIFGTLGPFVPLASLKELKGLKGLINNNGATKKQHDPVEIMSSSALVIIQIENALSDHLFSRLERALQNLRPEQLLLYFSQEIEAKNLGSTFYQFAKETEGVFPHSLPESLGVNRVIAFDEDWQPYLCGEVSHTKIWWAKLLPLLAKRVDISRKRRAFVRTLNPFFERRDLVPNKARLFSDFSIGLAGFLPFAIGLPAGIMVFRNLWLMGRKGLAFLGIMTPILFTLISVGMIALVFALPRLSYEYQDLAATAMLTLVVVGSPFFTYWLWRRISGRKIRYQTTFSGSAQPWWKNLLVIFITSSFMWVPYTSLLVQDLQEVSAVNSKLYEGQDLASAGKIDEAIMALQEAQNLEPGIDLDPYSEGIQNDPRAVAKHLAAKSKIWTGYDLAKAGNIEEAIAVLQEAQNLYPEVDLNPDTYAIEKDAKEVATNLANQARARVREGYNLASAGNVEEAIVVFQQAQNQEPSIDLNPYTEVVENDAIGVAKNLAASAKVWDAYDLAIAGMEEEAIGVLKDAQNLNSGVDLDPLTDLYEDDPRAVAKGWAAYTKVSEGNQLAKEGEAEKAELAFAEARKIDPRLEEDAGFWNDVGWWYSVGGHPEKAVVPSEKAVKLAESDSTLLGYCLDTRGLVRALTGNKQGAIEDFEAAIVSPVYLSQKDFIAERKEWIEALRKKQNPFTAELMEKLKND
jgi:tetratricopeptide (TPR) repeat protein/energy-coupling factor transporter ATP-binding protein EcfA2